MISRSNNCITASLHPVVIQSVLHITRTPCLYYQSSIINHRSSAHNLQSNLSVSRLNRIYFMISRPNHCTTASRCNSVDPAYNSYALSLLSIINHRSRHTNFTNYRANSLWHSMMSDRLTRNHDDIQWCLNLHLKNFMSTKSKDAIDQFLKSTNENPWTLHNTILLLLSFFPEYATGW